MSQILLFGKLFLRKLTQAVSEMKNSYFPAQSTSRNILLTYFPREKTYFASYFTITAFMFLTLK
jgi:hypothetical protein